MTTKKMSAQAKKVRDGIFCAPSRTYGETYIEPLIRAKFGLKTSGSASFDAFSADKKIKYEIKSSKVLWEKQAPDTDNIIGAIIAEAETSVLSRMIPSSRAEVAKYQANIQNVKRDDFDILIYVLLFSDEIMIFEIPSSQINAVNIPNWSDKHGRYDKLGKSGQFPVKAANIKIHISKYLKTRLTWNEATEIYEELSRNGEKHDKSEQIEKREAW